MEHSQTEGGKWRLQDIIYVAIVGTVMLAAILEWLLWLLAFLYCLIKVYQKAQGKGSFTIRFLALANIVFFTLMRIVFLPVMVVTLPLPPMLFQHFPERFVAVLQWFAFYTFAGLLCVPWLLCIYQLVTHNVGRTRRIKTVLDEDSAPKVVICMPCYKEEPDVLLRTVDSIVDCDYPPSCIHVFLSFDGDQEDDLYLNTLEKLGVPIALETNPRIIDIKYRRCRITVSRFRHGGKRHCQKKTFKLIDKIYVDGGYLRRNDNLFLLFIDSDCILDKLSLQNFMWEMELKPGSDRDVLAMTGVITSTTEKNTFITMLQDMEYVHGQLFERTVESGCGAVTCLPGALTILRFSAFREMSKYYFADKAEQCDDLFDYGKCHLGEDRWLTHLFMIGAKQRYQIQMNTGAFCKTEAVQTFKSLLKQRRRWFLGFITNEACMLTDIRLWKRYPLLILIRLAQNTIRTTALLFFILVISLLTTSQSIANLPVGFIAVSLGLNWALMLYFATKLHRYKILLYPLMFVLNPFLNWLYMVYGIFTAGQRTWGGPRADAGKADAQTTPKQVIEKAEDELNVVPETFGQAVEARRRKVPVRAPLLPRYSLDGRFRAAEEGAGGYYVQTNDSGVLGGESRAEEGRFGRSTESVSSASSRASSINSIYTPRRVESLVGLEDAVAYHDQQAAQRPPGGSHFEARRPMPTLPMHSINNKFGYRRRPSTDSARSSASDSSVSLHFGFPSQHQRQLTSSSTLGETSNGAARIGTTPATLLAIPASLSSQLTAVATSPLARKSFTRLATDDAASPVNNTESDRLSRRHSISGEERRGRRSISTDHRGRRRLSKRRVASQG